MAIPFCMHQRMRGTLQAQRLTHVPLLHSRSDACVSDARISSACKTPPMRASPYAGIPDMHASTRASYTTHISQVTKAHICLSPPMIYHLQSSTNHEHDICCQ